MEEQQTPTAQSPIYQESQEKNAKWLWMLIIFIIIAALVFAFFKGIGPFAKFSPFIQKEEVSPTPMAISSPSPTSTSEATPGAGSLNKAEPKIRVLNGSGTAGVASSFKDFLEGLGYKVASIGNANNYDYASTELRFKEAFKKFKDTLVSDLSSKYSVKVSSSDLEATDSADIEVIVGAK